MNTLLEDKKQTSTKRKALLSLSLSKLIIYSDSNKNAGKGSGGWTKSVKYMVTGRD